MAEFDWNENFEKIKDEQTKYLEAKKNLNSSRSELESVIQKANSLLSGATTDPSGTSIELDKAHKEEESKLEAFSLCNTQELEWKQAFQKHLLYGLVAVQRKKFKKHRDVLRADNLPALQQLLEEGKKNPKDEKELDDPLALLNVHWDDIELGKKIGEGAFGIVHIGTCKCVEVAIKVLKDLPSEQKDRFKSEATKLSALKHDGIVQFMGWCEDAQKGIAIVTEFAPNGSLADYLGPNPSRTPFSKREKLRILHEVVLGMSYINASNLLHLDLKPANILLDDCMHAKIADFGMSQALMKEADKTFSMLGAGAPGGGTPYYMAPEIFQGKPPTAAADVYSFGIMACEAIEDNKSPPYDEKQYNTLVKLKEFVEKGGRPIHGDDFKANFDLHKFYAKCWNAAPEQRFTFAELSDFSKSPWKDIISGFLANDHKSIQCWSNCIKRAPSGEQKVPWKVFVNQYDQTFNASFLTADQNAPKPVTCALAAILDVDLSDNEEKFVTTEAWTRLCSWFGPLSGETPKQVHKLVTQDWFFGKMTAHEANNRLMFYEPRTFLVRYSATQDGLFTLSYVVKLKDAVVVKHQRFEGFNSENIQRVIEHWKSKKIALDDEGNLATGSTKKEKLLKPQVLLKNACPVGRPDLFTRVPKQ